MADIKLLLVEDDANLAFVEKIRWKMSLVVTRL